MVALFPPGQESAGTDCRSWKRRGRCGSSVFCLFLVFVSAATAATHRSDRRTGGIRMTRRALCFFRRGGAAAAVGGGRELPVAESVNRVLVAAGPPVSASPSDEPSPFSPVGSPAQRLLPHRARPLPPSLRTFFASTPSSSPSNTSKPETKEEQRRFEKKQTIPKEELAKKVQKEREAARQQMTKAMTQERQQTRQEAEKAKQLTLQLQKKDAQLTALDAFYKEQLAQLEKRNLERYEQSKDQFHQAASKSEENVRSRNTDPVCLGLQAQILSCYKVNRDQTLKCSDLAKTYMQCINAAKKNLQVNHG